MNVNDDNDDGDADSNYADGAGNNADYVVANVYRFI